MDKYSSSGDRVYGAARRTWVHPPATMNVLPTTGGGVVAVAIAKGGSSGPSISKLLISAVTNGESVTLPAIAVARIIMIRATHGRTQVERCTCA